VCRFLAVPTTAHLAAPNFDLKGSQTKHKQEFKNAIDAGPLNSAEAKLLLGGRVQSLGAIYPTEYNHVAQNDHSPRRSCLKRSAA
jgi:hypothetical protein